MHDGTANKIGIDPVSICFDFGTQCKWTLNLDLNINWGLRVNVGIYTAYYIHNELTYT